MAIGEGDIILDSDGLMQFESGDLKIDNGIEQHLSAIMQASKGNFRRFPTLGADIIKDVDSPQSIRELEQKIRIEMEKDGYSLKEMDIITESNEIKKIYIMKAEKVTDNTESFI